MRFLLLCLLLFKTSSVEAEKSSIDFVAMTGNDEPFNSDGGGLTASFLFGAKYNNWVGTIWGGGYTPEYSSESSHGLSESDDGPFNMRITATVGKDILWQDQQLQVGGYIGADGLNRVGESIQCDIHSFWGTHCPDWPAAGNHNHVIAGGYVLWQAADKTLKETNLGKIKTSPFGYSSLGTAYLQGGGGIALDLIWDGELPLPAPDNGLYGIDSTRGQGIRAYIGSDAIIYDHILESHASNIIPYIGILGQLRWGRLRGIAEARCRTKAYSSADKADCTSNISVGFSL